jgi:hypothetical protein
MSTVARPRGPLPARVYWVRRLLLLTVAGLLVVGVHRVLTFQGGEDEPATAASTVGAPFELPTLAVPPSSSPEMLIRAERRKAKLPPPDGPCDPADVLVTPIIEAAHVGRPVQIILELTTTRSRACEFEVSGESVAVNVSIPDGARELLWTTQDCPSALAETTVVARRDVPGRAVAEWDGRRSDERCSVLTEWVLPGTYLVEAVALGGSETGEQEFELDSAVRETVTRSVKPTPSSGPTGGESPSSRPQRTASPTGAEADGPRSAGETPSATATRR